MSFPVLAEDKEYLQQNRCDCSQAIDECTGQDGRICLTSGQLVEFSTNCEIDEEALATY